MKLFITILLLLGSCTILISCKEHSSTPKTYYDFTTEVTFVNGEKDTIHVIGNSAPSLTVNDNVGVLANYSVLGFFKIEASYVRSFVILSTSQHK